MTSIEKFNSLLSLAAKHKASDIHLKTLKRPIFRINGRLTEVETSPFTSEDLSAVIETIVPPQFKHAWSRDMQADFSYLLEGTGRFRVNAFFQRGNPGIVMRHVKDEIPTFEQINHDAASFTNLCNLKNGIVLICGATGSGKSTTLAAMLNYINANQDMHIVTLEDPIEFSYTDKKSIINQREVGIDTPSFDLGMKAAMRQDPDIILVGEMRDADTFSTALRAAETGHLVFGTLHASSAQQAVQRLFEFFPSEVREIMQPQIAAGLKATVTQKLLPAVDGGRVPIVEMFVVDPLSRQIIEDGEFEKISRAIESSENSHCKSFNKDLVLHVQDGSITKSDAMAVSPNPKQLEMNLKGIFLSGGGIVD